MPTPHPPSPLRLRHQPLPGLNQGHPTGSVTRQPRPASVGPQRWVGTWDDIREEQVPPECGQEGSVFLGVGDAGIPLPALSSHLASSPRGLGRIWQGRGYCARRAACSPHPATCRDGHGHWGGGDAKRTPAVTLAATGSQLLAQEWGSHPLWLGWRQALAPPGSRWGTDFRGSRKWGGRQQERAQEVLGGELKPRVPSSGCREGVGSRAGAPATDHGEGGAWALVSGARVPSPAVLASDAPAGPSAGRRVLSWGPFLLPHMSSLPIGPWPSGRWRWSRH